MANITNVELERPWKAILQSHPTKSLLTLRSLWDVLYDNDGNLIKQSTTDLIGGFKLDHDIICYSTQEYSSVNEIYTDNGLVTYNNNQYTAETLYQLLCIDASIAQYDPRAKCKYIENRHEYMPEAQSGSALSVLLKDSNNRKMPIFNNNRFAIHDKDSVLVPDGQLDFINNCVYLSDIVSPESSYISTRSYRAPFTSKIDSVNSSDTHYPIYLVKEDNGFKGTLSASITMSAYNRLVFNPFHKWTAALVAKALWENFKYDSEDQSGIFNNTIIWNSPETGSIYNGSDVNGEFYKFIFSTLPQIIDNAGDATDNTSYKVNPNGDWAALLKNTYIWIKAPFFGDYIKPNVFNQDLNEGADVIHKNLILSKSADFNKYDETTNDTRAETINTATPPYVPSVSPTLDILSNKYLNLPTDNLNVSKDLVEKLLDDGDDTNKIKSNIGSIAIAPEFRKDKNSDSKPATIRLPNYFDPELKEDAEVYKRSEKSGSYHIPTIVPQTGNLYIDGRIISPTTDEIWTYLKQLTEGRMSDADTPTKAEEKDTSLPIGTDKTERRRNFDDTRLASVPNSEFQFKKDDNDVYGDVSKAEAAVDEDNNLVVSVTKHINNNDGIKYVLYDALKKISKSVTTFDENKSKEGIKSRDVVNFTAWAKKGASDEKIDNGDTVVDAQTLWAPRNIPLSLRELEASILGNKYNLNSFARFVKENYTVAGKLGYIDKILSDKGDGSTWVSAAGSLYQFHRDYNFNVEDPNTFFKLDGNGAPLSEKDNPDKHVGMDATFNDLTADGAFSEKELLLYDSNVKKTSKRPLLVANYGRSEFLPETEGAYYGSDVYLAADGTWRYKQEHVRLPILRSEY